MHGLSMRHQYSSQLMKGFFNAPQDQVINPKLNFYQKPQNAQNYPQPRITRRQQSITKQMRNRSTNRHQEGEEQQVVTNQTQLTNAVSKGPNEQKEKPKVPLLNINQVVFENNQLNGKIDPLKFPSTSHMGQQSGRSQQISSTSDQIQRQKKAKGIPLGRRKETAPKLFNQNSQPDQSEFGIQSQEEGNSFLDNLAQEEDFGNKLLDLAEQLGEACVAGDMAALVSQKRDMELERQARKTAFAAGSGDNKRAQFQMRQVHSSANAGEKQRKSSSVSPSLAMTKSKSQNFSLKSKKEEKKSSQATKQRIRTIILNMVCLIIEHYSLDEARFLQQPIVLFLAYFDSDVFRKKKQTKIYKSLQKLSDSEGADSDSDFEIGLDGKINKESNKFNIFQSKMQKVKEVSESSDDEKSNSSDNSQYTVSLKESQHTILNSQPSFSLLASHIDLNPQTGKTHYFLGKQIFKGHLFSEQKAITRLCHKFSFINEEALRRQVKNEQANFAFKDRVNKIFNPVGSVKLNNSFQTNLQGAGPSGTPLRGFGMGNLSFDDPEDEFLVLNQERQTDATSQLNNPSVFWSNQGIAYDISANSSNREHNQSSISKDLIRKKADLLLYQIDQRLKNILKQDLNKNSFEFAFRVYKELLILSSYLQEQHSRVTLFQIIDVNLESLLILKKIFIEISLRSNIFIFDFDRYMNTPEITVSGKRGNFAKQNSIAAGNSVENIFEKQQMHRQCFSEFIKIISLILRLRQTKESQKLLNEVFISDDAWQESVKNFTISVFLADLGTSIKLKNLYLDQRLEEIRGMNLVSFEEKTFFLTILELGDLQAYQMAKESVQNLILFANSALQYYQGVNKFFQDIQNQYFDTLGPKKSKQQNEENGKGAGVEDTGAKSRQNAKTQQNSRAISALGKDLNQEVEEDEEEYRLQRKYWRHVCRNVYYNLSYLIQPPNGLISSYLQNNATNYSNQSQNDLLQEDFQSSTLLPLNFSLTKHSLILLQSTFQKSDTLTKYLLLEETMLFFIRTCYLSFIRLYNKISLKQNFLPNQAKLKSQEKEALMALIKLHLECLLAMAQQRNEDTRRKFFQNHIVEFLTKEIDLEYEIQQRRQMFLKVSRQEQSKMLKAIEKEEKKNKKVSAPPKPPVEKKEASKKAEEVKKEHFSDDSSDGYIPPPITQQQKPKGLPGLKIGGLGSSSIVKEGLTKTAEELAVEQDVGQKFQQQQVQQNYSSDSSDGYVPPPSTKQQSKPKGLPSLKIGGLGSSTVVPEGQTKTAEELDVIKDVGKKFQQQEEEEKKEDSDDSSDGYIPPPVTQQQTKPKGLPGLKIGGLGSSSIIPEGQSKTAEELSVLQDAGQKFQQQIEEEKKENSDSSSDGYIPPPANQQLTRPMNLPSLKIDGLGSSSLVKDGQSKTQEELAVEQDVGKKFQQQDQISEREEESKRSYSSSDGYIPPPKTQQQQKPKGLPSLKIGGLGSSSIVPEGQNKTAEELSVIQDAGQRFQQQTVEEEEKEEESKRSFDSSSDDGYVPPVQAQQSKPLSFKMPGLKIGGLGSSSVIPEGQTKTNEELSVEQDVGKKFQQKVEEQQESDSSSDGYIPPTTIASSKPKNLPGLNIGGLGSSSLVQEGQSTTAEDQAVQQILLPPGASSNFQQTPQSTQKKIMLPVQEQNESEESDDFVPAVQNSTKPKFVPGLAIGGLGSSSLVPEGQQKTAEELDVERDAGYRIEDRVINLRPEEEPQQLDQLETIEDEEEQKNIRPLGRRESVDQLNEEQKEKMFNTVTKMPKQELPQGLQTLEQQKKKSIIDQKQMLQSTQQVKLQKPFSMGTSVNGTDMFSQQAKEEEKNQRFRLRDEYENMGDNVPFFEKQEKKFMQASMASGLQVESIQDSEQMRMNVYQDNSVSPSETRFKQGKKAKNILKQVVQNTEEEPRLPKPPSHKFKKPFFAADGEESPSRKDLTDLDHHPTLQNERKFYLKERAKRPLYQDKEMHALVLSLIMCLLLKPQRGTLDELYSKKEPFLEGKQNILYLLHFHLNNTSNFPIVELLLERVQHFKPALSGQRLLKLLCSQLFDLESYKTKEWQKIAKGAYGTVYEVETPFKEQSIVAIKQLDFPTSITDRCVLHDIFTEITCLEEFRLEKCVTDLYDYGVKGHSYYIVMRKYQTSLRDWRLKQEGSVSDNLPLYLSFYRDVLHSVARIHSFNVAHYDIKCDNVLIDTSSDKVKLTMGDFGECSIFLNDKDELNTQSRGTECIMSPEMTTLQINTNKETNNYDRRKKVGTTRHSDVWSLGCLLYELITGDYMFHNEDNVQMYLSITSHNFPILDQDKITKIGGNVYIIDFLKFILVRDPKIRPNIESVLKRFEHIHALLVNQTGIPSSMVLDTPRASMPNQMNPQLYKLLETCLQLAQHNPGEEEYLEIESQKLEDSLHLVSKGFQTEFITQFEKMLENKKQSSRLMRVMEGVFLGQKDQINLIDTLKEGITHIVAMPEGVGLEFKDKFDILYLEEFHFCYEAGQKLNSFVIMPQLMDFLRKCAFQKGRVLFIESNQKNKELLKEALVGCLSHIFQATAYETYTLIKSQNLFFTLNSQILSTISTWTKTMSMITQHANTYPKFQCYCGQCTLFLTRQNANLKNIQSIKCKCSQYYKHLETTQCPTPGCSEYLQFLKQFYHSQQQDTLHWGFVDEEDFFLGPNHISQHQDLDILSKQLLGNISEGIENNTELVSVIEKKNFQHTSALGHQPSMNTHVADFGNMISKSSATAKGAIYGNEPFQRWKLFKCKNCHIWTYAFNEQENKYAVLLNNQVTQKEALTALSGLLNNKELEMDEESIKSVKVPILKHLKLQLPF